MLLTERVRDKLRDGSIHVCVSDVSDGHTKAGALDGRALNKDGLELLILMVSDVFVGKSTLDRHRYVNSLLWDKFEDGSIHSVQIRALTNEEWETKGKPKIFRKGTACSQMYSNSDEENLRSEL